jgi:hypothetical protein
MTTHEFQVVDEQVGWPGVGEPFGNVVPLPPVLHGLWGPACPAAGKLQAAGDPTPGQGAAGGRRGTMRAGASTLMGRGGRGSAAAGRAGPMGSLPVSWKLVGHLVRVGWVREGNCVSARPLMAITSSAENWTAAITGRRRPLGEGSSLDLRWSWPHLNDMYLMGRHCCYG